MSEEYCDCCGKKREVEENQNMWKGKKYCSECLREIIIDESLAGMDKRVAALEQQLKDQKEQYLEDRFNDTHEKIGSKLAELEQRIKDLEDDPMFRVNMIESVLLDGLEEFRRLIEHIPFKLVDKVWKKISQLK